MRGWPGPIGLGAPQNTLFWGRSYPLSGEARLANASGLFLTAKLLRAVASIVGSAWERTQVRMPEPLLGAIAWRRCPYSEGSSERGCVLGAATGRSPRSTGAPWLDVVQDAATVTWRV